MTCWGLHLGGWQEAGVEESLKHEHRHLEVTSPQAQPGPLREGCVREPGPALPPASAPETPSFHRLCLIPANSRLTSRLRGLTLSLPQILTGLLQKINK